jgi:Na+/H+ antiporter NhaD/arsenite permease-like protein
MEFAARIAPIAVAGLAIDYAIFAWIYRERLRRRDPLQQPARMRAQRVIPGLAVKSAVVAAATLVAFALGYPTHLVALGAGAFLLFTRRVKPERIFSLIDWTLLMMFAGLFVVVAGVDATGVPAHIVRLIGVDALANTTTLGIVTAVLSNIVSNVPAVMLFRPVYPMLSGNANAALVLAAASTLAGNLTVLGSVANLIVIEQAARRGVRISFGEYLKAGLPVTIVTIAAALTMLHFGI